MKKFFLLWPPKKVFLWFSANVACHFLNSNNPGRNLWLDFQEFCPGFGQIKSFVSPLARPRPAPPLVHATWVLKKKEAKCKNWVPFLAETLIFSIILVSSRMMIFCVCRGVFVSLVSIAIHDIGIHRHFLTSFSVLASRHPTVDTGPPSARFCTP